MTGSEVLFPYICMFQEKKGGVSVASQRWEVSKIAKLTEGSRAGRTGDILAKN